MSVDGHRRRRSLWNNPGVRGLLWQGLLLLLLAALFADVAFNTANNLASRHIVSGWDFLWRRAGFEISFSIIPYTAERIYARALLAGLLNTLLVSGLGIVLATVLGLLIGVMRLSKNWLAAKMASLYIEAMRNVPLLLQLFIWYKLVLKPLPDARNAIMIGSVALSNKGLAVPSPSFGPGAWTLPAGLVIALFITLILRQWSRARQAETGQRFPLWPIAAALVIGLPLILFAAIGWPVSFSYPIKGNFGFKGGATLVPEFMALLLALSIYTAAFIAEAVRAGIEAVARGQSEAAAALGLAPSLSMRLVVLPQALRIIVPPLTNQYLNLTKNSSLAVAIGYPDLVSTGGTIIGQTGQAIEVVLVWMGVYLLLSLLTSAFMNWFNARNRLVDR